MPAKRLTELSVSTLKPSPRGPVDYYDAVERRLVLRVGKTSKVWRVVFRNSGGKIRSEGIGRWPELDVKNARIKAAALKSAARERIENPPVPPEPSFREIAEGYLQRNVDARGLRSARQIRRYVENVLNLEFGDRPFVSVRRGDIVRLLDRIEDERGAGAADGILAVIRQIAFWHQARDEAYHSPIARGMRRTRPAERRRKRILTDLEIRNMWEACDKLGVFGALTKTLLLTTQRRTKVSTMKWSDIEDGVWTIAVAHREKGTGEKLTLPKLTRDIIEAQPVVDECPYVFPASREGRRDGPGQDFGSFSAFGQNKDALDAIMRETIPNMAPWILHDLRRTGRSLMSRAGVRSEISERVLGHQIIGVEGVYDRHDYIEQRAHALKKLAALVARIINPPANNVVRIERRELA